MSEEIEQEKVQPTSTGRPVFSRTFSDGLSEADYMKIYDALAKKDVHEVEINAKMYRIKNENKGIRSVKIGSATFVGHVKKPAKQSPKKPKRKLKPFRKDFLL